jgi:putative SOS response-associated peptidase YedK
VLFSQVSWFFSFAVQVSVQVGEDRTSATKFFFSAIVAAKLFVAPTHPKAMLVILTTEEERDVWMRAP